MLQDNVDIIALHIIVFHFRCFKLLPTKLQNIWVLANKLHGFLKESAQSGGDFGLMGYGSGTGIQILIVDEGVEDVGIIVLLVVLELVGGHELASLLDDVTLDTSLVEDDVLVWFPVDLVVLLLNLYYSIGNK